MRRKRTLSVGLRTVTVIGIAGLVGFSGVGNLAAMGSTPSRTPTSGHTSSGTLRVPSNATYNLQACSLTVPKGELPAAGQQWTIPCAGGWSGSVSR